MKTNFILIFVLIFSIKLAGQNNAPQFTSVPDTVTFEGQIYIYQITATDSDGDSIIFLETDIPEWLSIVDPLTERDTAYLICTATEFFDTTTVIIGITDEIDTTYQVFNIVLICSSCGIYINTQPIDTAYVNYYYEYNILAGFCDPELEILFECDTLPAWLTLENTGFGTAVLSWTPSIDDKRTYEIIIRAYMSNDPCFNDTWQVFNLKVVEQLTLIDKYNISNFKIYPIPCNERLIINPVINLNKNYNIRIYDTKGYNLLIINDIYQYHELDISFLSGGVYFLEISDENNHVILLDKLIKL